MLNEAQFAKDYERLFRSYERAAYVVFKKALDAQCKAVATYAEANGVGLTAAILPALIDRSIMERAYIEAYTLIAQKHARNYSRLLDRLTKPGKSGIAPLETKLIGFSSEWWRRVMEQFFRTEAAGRVTEVDDTTKKRIQVLLAEAQEQNLTTTRLARYLREKLQDARFNATRAMMIARTESTTGANVAANMVAEEADFVLLKKWNAALDNRTRNSHRVVGKAEPIALEGLFEVPSPKGAGVEYARYPGDTSLSAGNCVNCRCVVSHVPALDADGLPIPKPR
ncbi:phage Mu protein F like protein [Pontibacter mucosus]|uniref:Phage Mu protein F like protein n=1 Tax=Pontibacter mucosus TaxID=1649266 RepID=A0A2T5YD48_9BACT|nr:phage minor head protein [Pontibacter mucosus]PTX14440.1 phage Mu protein F like protein [Pontibacter mucosus]